MEQPALVSESQGRADLDEDLADGVVLERNVGIDHVFEQGAPEALHDDEVGTVG